MIQQIWYIAFHYTQLVRSLETRIQYIQDSKYGRNMNLRATNETQVLNIQLSQNLFGFDKQHSDHLQILIFISIFFFIFVTSRTLKLHMNAYINMCGMEYPLLVCYFINWLASSKTSVEGWFFFFPVMMHSLFNITISTSWKKARIPYMRNEVLKSKKYIWRELEVVTSYSSSPANNP